MTHDLFSRFHLVVKQEMRQKGYTRKWYKSTQISEGDDEIVGQQYPINKDIEN